MRADRAVTRMSNDRVAMRLIVNRMTDRRLWKHYLSLRSVIIYIISFNEYQTWKVKSHTHPAMCIHQRSLIGDLRPKGLRKYSPKDKLPKYYINFGILAHHMRVDKFSIFSKAFADAKNIIKYRKGQSCGGNQDFEIHLEKVTCLVLRRTFPFDNT